MLLINTGIRRACRRVYAFKKIIYIRTGFVRLSETKKTKQKYTTYFENKQSREKLSDATTVKYVTTIIISNMAPISLKTAKSRRSIIAVHDTMRSIGARVNRMKVI